MIVPLSFEPPQYAAHQAIVPGATVGLGWGRGGGKSKFQRLQWYLKIAEWDGRVRRDPEGIRPPTRGVRCVLMMPTLEQAKKVHASPMETELLGSGEWAFLGARIDHQQWRVEFPGGSWIQWVTAERARNVRGMRCDVLSVDECDDVDPSTYDAILRPWFTEHESLKIKILSGTPTRGRYGLLYRTFSRARGKVLDQDGQKFENHAFVHATSHEFPHFVDPGEVERARRETTPQLYAREWLCDFDAAEGLVYPMFDDRVHVAEPNYGVPWTEILVGVDHGWNDPGVFLVAGVLGNGRDAIAHCTEEVYETAKDTTWWCEKAAAIAWKYRQYRQRWIADPSRPDRIADIRRAVREKHPQLAERFTIEEAKNELEAGVDALADRLMVRELDPGEKVARFYVAPGCRNTIREFGIYRRKRDPRDAERVLDDIADKDNHSMDCARYLVFTRFGGPDRQRHEIGG